MSSAQNLSQFQNSLIFNLPMYYHFLDAFTSDKIGSYFDINMTFINKYVPYDKSKIDFFNYSINMFDNDFTINTYTYKEKIFNNIINYTQIIDIDENYTLKTMPEIKTFINKVTQKYTIFQIGNNDHATSIVLYNTGNNINVLSVNSGLGLDNHEKYENNNDKFYLPYIGYYFDINSEQNYTKILGIMMLDILYKMIEYKYYKEKYYKFKYYEDQDLFEIDFGMFINIIKWFITNFDEIIIQEIPYKVEIDKVTYNNLHDFYIYISKNYTGKKYINKNNITVDFDNEKINFTVFFKKFFCDKLKFNKFNLSQKNDKIAIFNIDDISKFNINNNILSKTVINKLILHYYDNNLYIKEQNSGSCGWFSVYWSMIMYYVFNNLDTNYIQFIKETNQQYYNLIDNIFTQDNFLVESSNNYIKLYNNTYQKYEKIGILKSKINFNDTIYEINDILQHNKIQQISDPYKVIFDNDVIVSLYKNIDDFLNNKIKFDDFFNVTICDYLKLHSMKYNESYEKYNKFQLYLYKIFCITKNTNNTYFNINKTLLNTTIQIYKTIQPLPIPDKKITNIYTDIAKYLELFDKLCLLDPTKTYNFIQKYYHFALFTYGMCNKYNRYDKYNNYNLDLNIDEHMNDFCFFLHKYELFTHIMKLTYLIEDNNKITYISIINDIKHIFNITLDNISNKIINFKQFNYNLLYSIPHILPVCLFDNDTHNLKYNTFDITLLKKLKKIIIQNPLYIYERFSENMNCINLNNFTFILHYFIYYYIFDLTDIEKTNIIKFYSKLYLKQTSNGDKKHIIIILQILFNDFMNITIYDSMRANTQLYKINFDNIENFKNDNTACMIAENNLNVVVREEIINYEFILNDIKKKTDTDLQNITNESDYENRFADNVIKHKNLFIDKFIYYKKIIKKYIPTVIFDNNNIFYDNKNFNFIYFTKTLDNDNKKKLYTLYFNTNICAIQSNNIIYSFYDDFFLKFEFDGEKIMQIYVDEFPVIKYKDIKYPFKYFLPINLNYLIYIKNDIYHIRYFCNAYGYSGSFTYKNKYGNLIQFDINLFDELVTFTDLKQNNDEYSKVITINNNNLFFPDNIKSFYLEKKDENYDVVNNDFTLFGLCLQNIGINNYNKIFCREIGIGKGDKGKTNYGGFHLNEDTKSLYENLDFLVTKLKDINYTKINFIKKISSKPTNKYNFEFENNNDIVIKKFIPEKEKENYNDKINSINKLLNKIYFCNNISKSRKYLDSEIRANIEKYKEDINNFYDFMKNNQSSGYIDIFGNYELLYKYLTAIRINNTLSTLLKTSNENLCGQIKIYEDRFNIKDKKFTYVFEAFFEFYLGLELTKEQYDRYSQIKQKYNDYIKAGKIKEENKKYNKEEKNIFISNSSISQIGGNYPLHHLMMGKGKSAVLTPLLTLYFTLIHNKCVFIIVPEHLVKQTINTINNIAYLCGLHKKNQLVVISDSNIKQLFLDGFFHKLSKKEKEEYIFLIDEFDSLLDPLSSNYNIINDYSTNNINDIFRNVKYFIDHYKQYNNLINIDRPEYINIDIWDITKTDIKNIIEQIKNNLLKKNINWGINSHNLIAIPYANKDKPLYDSNFSSFILTIFLTMIHYYVDNINDNKFIINNDMIKYIRKYNLGEKIFDLNEINLTDNIIKNLLSEKVIYDKLILHIITKIKLPKNQLNTSFVDIINIDNIFKIGYSGTLDINLCNLLQIDNFTKDDIIVDYDEKYNVEYAIHKSKILKFKSTYNYNETFDNIKKILNEEQIKNYDVIIDEAGLFKNIYNEKIAKELYNVFDKRRPIIFLTESDDKMVIINDKIIPYNKFFNYENPFIYYCQSNIVGVDINQEKYPSLKGLCIIDKMSLYTNVAQAIFRLRKLNMGHTIEFYCVDNIINNTDDLLQLLKTNNLTNKSDKYNSLIYQTIKSIIRKIKTNNISLTDIIKFKEIYLEEIKYYYFNFVEYNSFDETNFNKFFKNIISYNDLTTIIKNDAQNQRELINMFKNNLNKKNVLYELVYNIGLNSTEINKQKEKDKEDEEEDEKKKQMQLVKVKLINNEIKIPYKPLFALSFKYEILNNLETHLDNIAINLIGKLYYLPSIFCNHTAFDYVENRSSIIAIYINDKLLLIPGYYIMYYYDKFPIFNLQLKQINGVRISNKIDIINDFKQYLFFKIFQYDTDYNSENIENIDDILLFIICLQISENRNLSLIQEILLKKNVDLEFIEKFKDNNFVYENDMYKYTKMYLDDIYNKILSKINYTDIDMYLVESTCDNYDIYTDLKKKQNVSTTIKSVITGGSTDIYYKKYIKYKTKYLKLLENYKI